jgi:hypothetical protein
MVPGAAPCSDVLEDHAAHSTLEVHSGCAWRLEEEDRSHVRTDGSSSSWRLVYVSVYVIELKASYGSLSAPVFRAQAWIV